MEMFLKYIIFMMYNDLVCFYEVKKLWEMIVKFKVVRVVLYNGLYGVCKNVFV